MSIHDAKQRRADFTTAALSRPFRPPFKAITNKTNKEYHEQPRNFQEMQHNHTISKHKVSSVSNARHPSFKYKRQHDVDLSLRSRATLNSQLEIASLLNAQRRLRNDLHCLKMELHLVEQARKIEYDPSEARFEDGEVDGELVRLAKSWKVASRQAAEELFGTAKDRINRMGGTRAWKRIQQKQLEFQSGLNDKTLLGSSADENGYNATTDSYTESNIDLETQNKRDARGEYDACEDWNEDVSLHDLGKQ